MLALQTPTFMGKSHMLSFAFIKLDSFLGK